MPPAEAPIAPEERLQRVLAARGAGSRRHAESLIVAGRVAIDGRVVTELGTKIDPRAADLRVDGKLLRAQSLRYLLLNKPAGYITTTSDERGRRTVMDLVPARERIYPVGRLDRDTEGLLLLTNDGEVANRVMHPRYALAKEYHVLTTARPSDETMRRVRAGVPIEGRRVVPDEFRLLRESREGVVLTIVIHEGLFHVVRRMMDAVGIPVAGLRRIRLGPLTVGGIPVGGWRDLTPGELTTLFEALRLHRDRAAPSPAQSANAPQRRPRSAPRPRGRSPDQEKRSSPAATGSSGEGTAARHRSPADLPLGGGKRGGTPPSRDPRGRASSPGKGGARARPRQDSGEPEGAPPNRHRHGDAGSDDRHGRPSRSSRSSKQGQRRDDPAHRQSRGAPDATPPRGTRRGTGKVASDDRREPESGKPRVEGGGGSIGKRPTHDGRKKSEDHAAGRPSSPPRSDERRDRRGGRRAPLGRRRGDEGEQRDAAVERTEP